MTLLLTGGPPALLEHVAAVLGVTPCPEEEVERQVPRADALLLCIGLSGALDAAGLERELARPAALIRAFVDAGPGDADGAARAAVLVLDRMPAAAPAAIEAMVPALARAAAPRARVNAVLLDREIAPRDSAAPPPFAAAVGLLLSNRAMTGQTIRTAHDAGERR